jgi:hypothetical protein
MEREAILGNLSDRDKALNAKLHEGMRVMAENDIINACLKLQNDLLPKLIANRGKDHADTKFIEEIRDCLLWSLYTLDKSHDLGRNYYNLRLLNETLFERCRVLEKELLKYQGVDEMLVNETLDEYKKTVKGRLLDLLGKH